MIAFLLRAILALQIAAGASLGLWIAPPNASPIVLVSFLAFGALASFLIHPIIIGIDFAITRVAGSPVPQSQRLGPTAALRTYAGEVAAGMRSFYWAHPFLEQRKPPPARDPVQPIPIFFVHGYFCNRAIWIPFMRRAAQRGYRCGAVTLESPFGPIDGYALEIETAYRAFLAAAKADQAVVVAHSMGGLAARAWMRRCGSECVARLITLGSPHAGTVMAALGHGGNVAQMRRHSAWLRQLDSDESIETRAKMTCLYSYHDNIVAPQLSATLEGARNVALAGRGHVRLVYDPAVWDTVLAEASSVQRRLLPAQTVTASPSEE